MKRKAEIAFSLMMVFVFAVVLYEARGWRIYAKLLPFAIGLPMLAMALAQLVLDLRKKGAQSDDTFGGGIAGDMPEPVVRKRTLTIVGYLLGLFLSVWLLVFSISIPLFTFLYLKLESGESWWLSILLTVVAWVCIIGLFEWLLEQPFPQGLVISWLMDLFGSE